MSHYGMDGVVAYFIWFSTKGVKCPIVSRWECVGDTVNHVMTYKEEWLVVSKNITNTEPSGSLKHIIASYLYRYLKESPELTKNQAKLKPVKMSCVMLRDIFILVW